MFSESCRSKKYLLILVCEPRVLYKSLLILMDLIVELKILQVAMFTDILKIGKLL